MSQLGQDEWVLSVFPNKEGYFVDIGCADGIYLSNTNKLEQNGWKGLCIDVNPTNYENRPNTKVVKKMVYSEKNIKKNFILSEDPTLSGIIDHLGYWKNHVLGKLSYTNIEMETSILVDILDENNAPKYIDYLSIDIEGSEYEVIRTFPFDKYTFGCITIEHNDENDKRMNIRNILENNNYSFIKEVAHDDWYIHNTQNNKTIK